MDRTEAKLKFGNSLASSSIGAFISANNETGKARTLELKKEEKRHKKKENHKTDSKKNVNNYNVSNKSDFFCSYFFSLLRSHSSENGDNFPVIEFNVLKSVAFIVEAYLFHINLMDELEIKISALSESNEDGEVINFLFLFFKLKFFKFIFSKWMLMFHLKLLIQYVAFINVQSQFVILLLVLLIIIMLSSTRLMIAYHYLHVHIFYGQTLTAIHYFLYLYLIEHGNLIK